MSVFEQMGGAKRMVEWADENPTDFYTKLLPKIIQKSAVVDITGSITIDDALDRLEKNTIEGQYKALDKQDYDF